MFSVIVAINDEEKYKSNLYRSLNTVKDYLLFYGLPELQIIEIRNIGTSLTEKYNYGLSKAIYQIKFFIHEDLDINDDEKYPLFFKILHYFYLNSNVKLIGLVGTKDKYEKNWWWEGERSCIYGHVLNAGSFTDYYKWNTDDIFVKDILYIDGMFMATNDSILFPEEIKGYHFYDVAYSDLIINSGYEIGVITHLTKHASIAKDLNTEDISKLRNIYLEFRKKITEGDRLVEGHVSKACNG